MFSGSASTIDGDAADGDADLLELHATVSHKLDKFSKKNAYFGTILEYLNKHHRNGTKPLTRDTAKRNQDGKYIVDLAQEYLVDSAKLIASNMLSFGKHLTRSLDAQDEAMIKLDLEIGTLSQVCACACVCVRACMRACVCVVGV